MIFYEVNPRLQRRRSTGDRVEMSIPFSTECIRVNEALASQLESLALGQPQTELAISKLLGEGVFKLLLQHAFLLRASDTGALAGGISTPAKCPAGKPILPSELYTLTKGALLIAHVPISTTASGEVNVTGGGRLVRAHLAQSLGSHVGGVLESGDLIDLDFGCRLDTTELQVFDVGDVTNHPLFDRPSDVGQRAAHICRTVIARDAIPILLGGDHALAYYSIGAFADRYPELGVLQFDAHPDLYSAGASCDSELNHANVMHFVREMPHVQALWQIGVRDFYHQSTSRLSRIHDPKVKTLSAFEAETVGYKRLLDNMNPNIPWFISFDVDALASAEIPQTATPVLGGLSFYPLLACFETVLNEFNVCGMEFVEIGDSPQKAHGTAAVAARLISRIFFQSSAVTPTDSAVYR